MHRIHCGRGAVALAIALLLPPRSANSGDILFTEIHHAPADKTAGEEFVELQNRGPSPVDLGGWCITGAVEYVFASPAWIAPGGFLVIAESPGALEALYPGSQPVGPFLGRLSNQGETLLLWNASGHVEDKVDYGRGFPWPVAGGARGSSIELLDAGLDNELGGSWRLSKERSEDEVELIAAGADWRYFKGAEDPSAPLSAWRLPGFSDSSWLTGPAPIGYGEPLIVTNLPDMRGAYSTLFFRKTFTIESLASAENLLLSVLYDDGYNAWINGRHVVGENVASDELSRTAAAVTSIEVQGYADHLLRRAREYLVEGENVLAVQLHNGSINSSDAVFDARLSAVTGDIGPTPGRSNSVASSRTPPILRQLQQTPQMPRSGETVLVEVLATDDDGVVAMTLEVQVVEPGSYIRLFDPAFETQWTSMPMHDDGLDGDQVAGDGVYSATLPGSLQIHRRLVRYRIAAEDAVGDSVRVPYADDPQPNFAYFVYDGLPPWRGAFQPGVTPVLEFPAEVMGSTPAYHLIALESDVLACQYNSSFENTHFYGTLVYDGEVYDHVEFEVRGEFSTYVSGKNKWRFHFQRGHEFQARDDFGKKYGSRWRTLNLGPCSTPWVPSNRGMAGLDERLAMRLYELAGAPAPRTHYLQLRVIDELPEAHPTDQYRGDLWGLYISLEHTDGAFLDDRDLPDGNLYKIEGGNGDKRNQGPTQAADASDYTTLRNGYNASQPLSWWRSNVDLLGYYAFRAVDRAVNNMDLREGWNICQYHNPVSGLWTAIPWDLDMLYMPVTHWSGVMNFQNALLQHAVLELEYESRARELADLLLSPEAMSVIIGELVARIRPPGSTISMVDVDEALWNYHPRTTSGHRGAFYLNPSTHTAIGGTIVRTLTSADHGGMAQWILDFVTNGYGAEQVLAHIEDPAIPDTPQISYLGSPGFPLDRLIFATTPFSDPQGSASFWYLEWRVAEVTPAGESLFDPLNPKRHEVIDTWRSEKIFTQESQRRVPPWAVGIGSTYRVRVRMTDATGRSSHWSEPVQFRPSLPLDPVASVDSLRITELHYHPAGGDAESDELEFLELQNIGASDLDLTPVALRDGIEFDFAAGDVPTLGPGELVVVVRSLAAFRKRYPSQDILVAGEYSGQLQNGGERILLAYGRNLPILDFEYDDAWEPTTDGGGRSLVIRDPLLPAASWSSRLAWKPSAADGGSPGSAEPNGPEGGYQLPGDTNQDGDLDVSDAIVLLLVLFGESSPALPCSGGLGSGSNLLLYDIDGSDLLDLTDAVRLLGYLYVAGAPPALGTSCMPLAGCDNICLP